MDSYQTTALHARARRGRSVPRRRAIGTALRTISLDDKLRTSDRQRVLPHRHAGGDPHAADAARARPSGRPRHRGLRLRLSRFADRRASTSISSAPRSSSRRRTSSSSRASTRSSPPPPYGAPSRRRCAARASMTASSASGTARARASIAPAMSSATPTWPAPRPTAAVLALMGDDHTAESSTVAHQSEFHFVDVMMPILNPAGVQEILDYGLYGFAMSRFTGTWVAFKCVKDNIESTASVDASPGPGEDRDPRRFRHAARRAGHPRRRRHPGAGGAPATTTSATPCSPSCAPTTSTASCSRAAARPKIGVITVGKSYLDVRQAMDELGLDEVKANDMGLRLYKVACPWPLSQRELVDFARGLDLVMVVEEKRSLIEVQVREGTLRHREPADLHRQEGRGGQVALPRQGRARFERDRGGARRAAAALPRRRRPRRARRAHPASAGGAGPDDGRRHPHAAFLRRLPAQHLDQGAGGHAGLRRHRLSLHGPVDGARHRGLHPDGR